MSATEDASCACLVIGIGNPDRGDDGVGSVVARRIRARSYPGVSVMEQTGQAADLIGVWQALNPSKVYVVDAMSSGAAPGTIRRFDVQDAPLPAAFRSGTSTHDLGLVQAVELARVLGCLPPRVIVYGIEGQCFDLGAALSAEVEAAALQTAEQIIQEIRQP